MTYLQIINTIKDTALSQPNVNSVVREFLDLNREDAKYSAVVIQDRDGSRDRIVEQDYVTYTWHLGYVDRLTYDESNRDDIISTGINIINNIVNTIRNTWFPELEVSIVDRINTFDQRFTAQCAGVYVVLAVNAQVSDCVDSESTDLYDTYDAKITENGVYHFIPTGRPVDEINITVDVNGWDQKSITEGTNIITNLDNSASFVASYAFYGNRSIQTVNLPYATTVGTSAFDYCRSLTKVSLPMCSYIGSSAFTYCYSLSQVNLPVCSYIDEFAFASCSSLTQISLPVCSYIAFYTFYNCSSLSQVNLPVCSYIGSYAFADCSSLSQVNLPVCSFIGSYAFYNCSSLSLITIGYSSICSLGGSTTFSNTQITSSTGSIYVPASLVDAYKTADNWSYLKDRIFTIPS